MDSRRRNRQGYGRPAASGNGYVNSNAPRPFVKMDRISMDRITQIPSPFHHSNSVPSPYSRRMPARHGPSPMQMVGSPYQIFSPRHQQGYHGLPPVPPYPFHNVDLTPRRRQGPVTRSKSAARPVNNQPRLTVKPTARPQLSARLSVGPSSNRPPKPLVKAPEKQAKAPEKQAKPIEKPATKVTEKQVKPADKPTERPKRESLKPEPARRRSVAPPVRSATDFIERNKINAGRRKSVDPSALREMKAPQRQSLARAAKTPRPEVTLEPVEIKIDEPTQPEPEKIEKVQEINIDHEPAVAVETIVYDDEAKENAPVNVVDAPPLKKAKLDNSDMDEEKPESPKQTTSLFLQYLDIKKDDLPNIVADYDSQAAAQPTKESKKNRCAIM